MTTCSQTDGYYRGVECSGAWHVFPSDGQGVDQARGVHKARQAGEREFCGLVCHDKALVSADGAILEFPLQMFTAVLNVVCFTLPSNVLYIASYLAESSQFLDHPLPYYIPENHFDAPVYYNPHNPPPEGFRAIKRNRLDMMIGRGAAQQQKTIDVQRDQVDQVFMALPSHDELPETNPGDMIKTKLFPHQLKAITFLQQRESESAAIKAATAASLEDQEVVDVDAEMTEEEKKKQIKRMKKKAEKDAKKKGVNSLWVPEYDSSGKKIKGWKHMVTEEVHKGKDKPAEARGAILADEVSGGMWAKARRTLQRLT